MLHHIGMLQSIMFVIYMWDSSLLQPHSNYFYCCTKTMNHLTPNGHYMGRTAQLTPRCCILYIYSTNICTEYFEHAA